MIIPIDVKIEKLAECFPVPVYLVGGYVRNFLIGGFISEDVDLAAPLPTEKAAEYILKAGLKIVAEYKRTGTVVFTDGEKKYEYTSFRTDEYTGGGHNPEKTTFTTDIILDAYRRDFKCNAVYYDLKNKTLVDPLGGINDIKNKILDTVNSPEIVFSHDGLRLMRLARFSGELNFMPTKSVIDGAKKYAKNINDIKKERILEELKKILVADKKYPFSDVDGHYTALKILDDTRVLDEILPELTLGRGLKQRSDFHKYDVLEHSLKTVLYADGSIRLSALLHDVGKPAVFFETGRYKGHDKRGEIIVREIAGRLKFGNREKEQAAYLTRFHMVDLDLKMKENKIKLFIVENIKRFSELMLLKQADFSACKDDTSLSPTVSKWQKIYEKIKEENLPFSVKELKITAIDLVNTGVRKEELGSVLKELLKKVILGEIKNEKQALIVAARKMCSA